MSSWSPIMPAPLDSSTPTTSNGSEEMRMVWPTGSSPPRNRLSRTVVPITHTLARPRTSWSVKNRPRATSQPRMTGNWTPEPWMKVW